MRIGVFGAGAVGTYIGVRLSAGGNQVVLIGRRELVELREPRASSLSGVTVSPQSDMVVTENAEALRDVETCLVTVKSSDTEIAGTTLFELLAPDATVISLQNGRGNAERLRVAGLQRVLAGMVSFNIVRDGSCFRQATSGPLMIETPQECVAGRLLEAFERAGQPLRFKDDLDPVLVGKLLLNLNNGLCATTGLSIAESVRSKDLRRCLSICMREGLRIIKAAGLRAERIEKLAPGLIARLLLLPNFIFNRVARSMITIDPSARSSTLQDLERGKRTEIDFLNGEIVRLAEEIGVDAPANRFIVDTVHRLEASDRPLPFLGPKELLSALTR